ncbi:AsmA-like C-terminal region-containing protein [Algoriphagus sp. D3-2-R+10]|uniref:AsmA-like C-terminal region-containing protein n=1 Tax=Algoriphagus aurantiacus TaxID=3103948 RepID=UPI002B3F71BF|nr:AsmA-like C-terminal region-containing protein [Algoriphagus sp. D3-2-R+10]MEB2773966.1 AsmA-like C-terminal region-containing protein [Algoriphagus sp. D3-2-R+10]
MKKTLIIVLSVFLILIAAAIAVPFLFKDKIAARIDREIAQSVNAKVIYDIDNVSLSLFRSFPNVSAKINDLDIVGNAPFENDTLVSLRELTIDFNLKSVLFDDYPTLTGVHLNGGDVYIKVLEDGTANYDITFPSEELAVETNESNFRIGVDEMDVRDLNLVYDDRQLNYFMALGGINAKGSGDFTTDVYDLPIEMEALIADITYEDISYLSNKSFEGEALLNIDLENMKFTLSESNLQLNDFLFGMNGYLAMPTDDIEMDIAIKGIDNEFKSILSLVPGIYTESFSSLNTSGTMDFAGTIKGIYNDNKIPSFDISLKVADGMFQYPDLPRPVKNVNLDLHLKNETDNIDNTSISIPTFNLDFGNNPISGKLYLSDLVSYTIDAALKGKLDLEELTSIFPIEGIALKGNLDVDATAKGKYDSVARIIPATDAKLNLANGYVKSADYPAPIENLNVNASVQNPSGSMTDFLVDLSQFGFELEGEAINGNMKIRDFEKLIWDGEIKGGVDLKKILAIFPMEDMNMEGRIQANINTKGSYAAVEAEKYNQLETRGSMDISNFKYSSSDVPQGVQIAKAKAEFTPELINLTEFDSKIGESPLQATGTLSNYMDYFLGEKGTLKGQLALNSSRFNVNEWMSKDSSADTTNSELSVIELPENIDFSMTVAANEVLYDNMSLKDVKGNMALKDGVLTFSDASMKTMGGTIGLAGNYDPRDLTAPAFNFNLNIAELSIAEAFKSFNTIKAFAPIAQNLTGKFNSKLIFSGKLGQDMMPLLSSLDGEGLLKVAETALKDSKILEGITSLTKLKDVNTLQMKNISIPISIENGVMDVKPFDVKLWDYEANVQGTAGFDGSINYLINLLVPAGKFGSQANSLLASISGTEMDENATIPVALNLSGTYNSPKITLAGGNSIESLLANALKARVSGEAKDLQTQATEQFNAAQDSMKQVLKAKSEVAQDSAKKELEKQVDEAKDKAVDEAKKLLKGFFPKSTPAAKPDTTTVKKD